MFRRTALVLAVLACLFQISLTDSCAPLVEDRTVYTSHYDAANGHNLLTIKMTTSTPPEGWVWQDVVNTTNKYGTPVKPYVICSVTIGDQLPMDCEASRRGDWAFTSPLPSLKVEFKHKGKWMNLDRIILNKSPYDATRVRNKLVFESLQTVPDMISAYTGWAELYVDGTYYGLYVLIEDLTDDMLKNHMIGKNSWLYKTNNVFWDLSVDTGIKLDTDPTYTKDTFEEVMDIRGNTNSTPIVSLYQDVFNANLDTATLFNTRFNVDNFASWLAIILLIEDYDLSFNNYALYSPQQNGSCSAPTRFYFLCWDNDGALDLFYYRNKVDADYSRAIEGIQYFWDIRPIARFLQEDSFVDILVSKMDSLVANQFSATSLTNLINIYKPVIQPVLSTQPDIDYLYESVTIDGWNTYIDGIASIPAQQRAKWDSDWVARPMPIKQYQTYSTADQSSLFFHWDQSYILYHKPLFYQLYICTDKQCKANIIFSQNTTNTWMSVPTSTLQASTLYYYKVIVRNQENPDIYQVAMQNTQKAYGILSFTTPATIASPAAAPAAPTIAGYVAVTTNGITYTYATIDSVDPSATASGCTSSPAVLPAGWTLAPNSYVTRTNLQSLGKPWGTASLVLADGTRVDPATGAFIDGFATNKYFLVETAFDGGVLGYSADCTSKPISNKRVLIVSTTGTATGADPAPTTPAAPSYDAMCCASTLFLANATDNSDNTTTSTTTTDSAGSTTASTAAGNGKGSTTDVAATSDALLLAPVLGVLVASALLL